MPPKYCQREFGLQVGPNRSRWVGGKALDLCERRCWMSREIMLPLRHFHPTLFQFARKSRHSFFPLHNLAMQACKCIIIQRNMRVRHAVLIWQSESGPFENLRLDRMPMGQHLVRKVILWSWVEFHDLKFSTNFMVGATILGLRWVPITSVHARRLPKKNQENDEYTCHPLLHN